MGEQTREIRFERWWNVRDLGGLPTADGGATRYGVLVRAASPGFATPADTMRARALGLTTFVDLRMAGHPPDWRRADASVITVGVDVVGSLSRPTDIAAEEVLPLLLRGAAGRVAEAVREVTALAGDRPPVVFHCHTGKDRTGALAMLLLSLAGVPDDVVVEDYLASNPEFEAMRRALVPEQGDGFMGGAPAAVQGPVPEEGARRALRVLADAGGVGAYLREAGLTEDEVAEATALLR